jgi:hypothetical protein
MMLAPAAAGQPGIIAGPVTLAARMITASPAAWNAAFATIQLALGAGLLWRATARAALAGTVAWSLSVWWLGEGAGGIFGGAASPLTGAPGAALLYALLAVLIWPSQTDERPGLSVAQTGPLGRYAKPAWVLLWAGMAALTVAAPDGAAPLTSAGGGRADAAVIAFAAAFTIAAVGVLVPLLTRPALVIAVITAAIIWAAGEQFGGILTGQATDPNTGPLLILIAVAYWPPGKKNTITPTGSGGSSRPAGKSRRAAPGHAKAQGSADDKRPSAAHGTSALRTAASWPPGPSRHAPNSPPPASPSPSPPSPHA